MKLFETEQVKKWWESLNKANRGIPIGSVNTRCEKERLVKRTLNKWFAGKYYCWIENVDTGFETVDNKGDRETIYYKKKTYICITGVSYVLGWGEKIVVFYIDAANHVKFNTKLELGYNELIRLEGMEISSEEYKEVMKLFVYDEPMKTFTFQAYDMRTLVGKGKNQKYKKLSVFVDAHNYSEAKRKLKDSEYWIVWNNYTEKLL